MKKLLASIAISALVALPLAAQEQGRQAVAVELVAHQEAQLVAAQLAVQPVLELVLPLEQLSVE